MSDGNQKKIVFLYSGPVVYEDAPYERLKSGAIAGTTLDTWTRRLNFAFGNFQRADGGEAAESLIPG